ncbi:MAG TPA: hypothetical protein VMM92_00525 [Thermoanaerobaculia bacterium]|nr:hypothetical protein [Thermoanaerobaculia bacterium]
MASEVFTIDFRVPGLTARVFTNDATFATSCSRLFYERPEPEAEPDVLYSVYVDRRVSLDRRHSVTLAPEAQQIVLVTSYYPSLLPALESDVLKRALDGMQHLCPLRGGAVAWKGRALLVLGEYEDGRNLLVKALVDRGCLYLADSTAVLTPPERAVLPFPKSLALKRAHQPLVARHRLGEAFRDLDRTTFRYLPPPEESPAGPQPIEALLFPVSAEEVGEAGIRPLGRGEALDRLVAASYHIAARGPEIFPYLLSVAARARSFAVGTHGLKRTTDRIFEQALGEVPPPVVPAGLPKAAAAPGGEIEEPSLA